MSRWPVQHAREDATGNFLEADAFQNHMTAALPNLGEAEAFEYADCICPETRGSLGIVCLKDGYQRTAGGFGWKFFQVEFRRLFEICYRFFDAISLADCPHFRALRHVKITLLV
jgi:hypothetical protein